MSKLSDRNCDILDHYMTECQMTEHWFLKSLEMYNTLTIVQGQNCLKDTKNILNI